MSNFVETLTSDNFVEFTNNQLAVVDFWATWCGPCKMQAPILHEFKDEIGDKAIVAKVDVDVCEKLAVELGVMSIPTLMVFKNGELKEKTIGLTAKPQLSEMILKHID